MNAVEAVHRASPEPVDITNTWVDTPLDLSIQRNSSQKMIDTLHCPNEIDENYCLSSSKKNVGNENTLCKLDDQFPSSVKSTKHGSGRCNLIRKSKSSETSAVEDCKSIQNGNTSCGIKIKKQVQLLKYVGSERSIDRPSSDPWDVRYEELLSYVKEFGDARVPGRFAENIPLGTWVIHQRSCYKKFQNGNTSCNITKERIQLLNNIGFEWSMYSSAWNVRYEELVRYVKEIGNTFVPCRFAKNPFLGNWVVRQRGNYKKFLNGNTSCGITTYHIQQLNNIGFEWNSYAGYTGSAPVPQKFFESHILDDGLARKA